MSYHGSDIEEYDYSDWELSDILREEESWAPIDKGRNYYISDHGRILSLVNKDKPRIMRHYTNRYGHHYVDLRINGKKCKCLVHRLVAEAFLENPNNLPIVRHLDDDPNNNYDGNLRYGTPYDNIHDAIKHGRMKYPTKDAIEKANAKRRKRLKVIDVITGEEYVFESQADACRALGLSQAYVTDVYTKKARSVNRYYCCPVDEPTPTTFVRNTKWRDIVATNLITGEQLYFHSQREVSDYFHISQALTCLIINRKCKSLPEWRIKYAD